MFNADHWVLRQREQEKARKRRYPHFDPKIQFSRNVGMLRSFLSNPRNVETHSFYPLIWSTLTTPRFKLGEELDSDGQAFRTHGKKDRAVAYAAHLDAFIYTWYADQLNDLYEAELHRRGIHDCVLAYLRRDNQTNYHYAKVVFDYVKQRDESVVLAFDLRSFFDTLDHGRLKTVWKTLLKVAKLPKDHFKVFQSITDFVYVEKKCLMVQFPSYRSSVKRRKSLKRICEPEEFREVVRGMNLLRKNPNRNTLEGSDRKGMTCGIPQGTPMSAVLSNMYMLDFDTVMDRAAKNYAGAYWRYSDDILLVCPKENAEALIAVLRATVRSHEISIQDGKTDITWFRREPSGTLRGWTMTDSKPSIHKRMQYLGLEFDGQKVYLRSSSVARYQSRLRARVRETLKAAHGKRSKNKPVSMKRLYDRYTERGEGNFISYALRAAKHLESNSIRLQVKESVKLVRQLLTLKQQDADFIARINKKGPRPTRPKALVRIG